MKKLGKSIGKAFVFCAVMMLLCSFAYPLALTGISQVAMKEKANGNLIDKNGNSTADPEEAVGSALVGQDFTEDYFFKGRVSSVNYNTYTCLLYTSRGCLSYRKQILFLPADRR